MTLQEWATRAGIKLSAPNDKGRICITCFDALDQEVRDAAWVLEDYFIQSPPRIHLASATTIWMQKRAQVLGRAPANTKEIKRAPQPRPKGR